MSRAVSFCALCCVMAAHAGSSGPVEWPLEALRRTPVAHSAPQYCAGGVDAAFLEALPWRGRPTRAFCYYGVPPLADAPSVPGVVLVHGGGGSAFRRWVCFWNDRGYAAVSVDTCGCISGNAVGEEQGGHFRHALGGPAGWGGFDQLDDKPCDQWMYHAVADAIIANSFLRSLPGVDPRRVGITGVSWGGVVACLAAANDDRFRFVAPVYGCGAFLGRSSMWEAAVARMGAERVREWQALWDPVKYLPGVTAPMLWLAGTNDRAFALPALMDSFALAGGERHLSVKVRLAHCHGPESEMAPEVTAFADAFCMGLRPLASLGAVEFDAESRIARCKISGSGIPREVRLVYTTGSDGLWERREWLVAPGTFLTPDSLAMAWVPAGATAFFFSVVDDRGLVASSCLVASFLEVPCKARGEVAASGACGQGDRGE